MKYYVYWKQILETTKDDFKYRDDVGKFYHVEVINETEYNQRLDKEHFKKHWANDRFIELAGLVRIYDT